MSLANRTFKAIADPARREILSLLRDGERSAGELATHFSMSKPTMSHHFAVLLAADLIRRRRDKQTIWYSLNTTVLQDVLTWVVDLHAPATRGGKV
ncbi:MAG: autorepressor SdpR family transcription factor [Burkholderiaceae bacterium]|nr:autorepressor SdpR family transcription factor [Burkholderiaceae bacterium]